MPLPKYLTTVTPFSKYLALSLFIILPLVSFYLGIYFQRHIQSPNYIPTTRSLTPAVTPSFPQVTISRLTPSSGSVNTVVTIQGSGFTPENNNVKLGTEDGEYYQNGKPVNVIATVPSLDGKTIQFTFPISGPSGILCDSPTPPKHCVGVAAVKYTHGIFAIVVENSHGRSNIVQYTIPASPSTRTPIVP